MQENPHDSREPSPLDRPVTRRRALDLLLGGSFVAWAAAVVFPVLKYLTPPKDAGGASKVTLDDAQKGELAAKSFLIARMGNERVIVVKDPEGKLKALSAKCTHEGCTVQYAASEAMITCACHNGRFNLDGRVISGPPPRPLTAFVVTGDLGGAVTITKGAAA